MRLVLNKQEIPPHLLRFFKPVGHKPKDLIDMPSMLAEALRQDGWWLRSEITWAKKSPMPESVTDRPTNATEKIYLLSKSPRYYYDSTAVREPTSGAYNGSTFTNGKTAVPHANVGQRERIEQPGRNMWNYWLLGPSPFPGQHFATFSPEIPRRAISAGTSAHGHCSVCGAGWVRVVKRSGGTTGNGWHDHSADLTEGMTQATYSGGLAGEARRNGYKREDKGWRASCPHTDAPVLPAVVLDPFHGAGTTTVVARRLNRRAIGIDLNPQYVQMSIDRILNDNPMWNSPPEPDEARAEQGELWSA
jgi:hypothetical protein